jgi:hypothetical protein
MIDPLSAGFIDLEEAVARTASDISDEEVREERARKKLNAVTIDTAALRWVKREMAIARLYAAFRNGALIALARESDSGGLSRLIGSDWKQAAFWRETIVGGMVRAQMGEEIAPYEGRRILLDAEAFNAWLEAQQRRRSHPSQADCRKWLEGAMRQAPNRGSKSKREWRKDAKETFNVSGRAFDRIWAAALESTGANWDRQGPPTKAPR